MKKLFCLTAILGLAACDRAPQLRDVTLICEDTAGQYLINATLYKDRADMHVQKIAPISRDYGIVLEEAWSYLGQHIPDIDDEITVSLKLDDTPDICAECGTVYTIGGTSLDVRRDEIVLWEFAPSGDAANGNGCHVIKDYVPTQYDKIPADKLHDIKNCVAYIDEQLNWPDANGFVVRDADTQTLVSVSPDKMAQLLGVSRESIEHFRYAKLHEYQQEMLGACDAATRLREYARAHADAGAAKLYKCIDKVASKTGIDVDARAKTLSCGNFEYYTLTATQARALSPAWDYSRMRDYNSFKHVPEPHEQDACAVLERVNTAIEKYCGKPAE